jgi:6-phospho-beta-glucosidase
LAGVWRAIHAKAPTAQVVNLTNPAGIVTRAAAAAGLRVVSVCDSPITFTAAIASALARGVDDVRTEYVGMNHAGFWAGGTEDERIAAIAAAPGIEPRDVAAMGALPASYLAYYLHPERLLAGQVGTEPRAQRLRRLQAELLAGFAVDAPRVEGADGDHHRLRRGAGWYGLSVVPLIDAVANGADAPLIIGRANGGRVPWADDEATIEGPVRVGRGATFEPQVPVDLPAAAAALLERHAAYESLTVAALAGPPDRPPVRIGLVRALAANPMVPSVAIAERLVDRILAASP